MSESSGDGPARRQGGIEPERNQTGSERTPDQDAATPVRPAPEPPAPDADGAAAPAADEPAGEPGIDQKAQPERPPDRADEAPEPIEHADRDMGALGDAEPEREPAGDARTEREPERAGDPETQRAPDPEPAPDPEQEPEPAAARDSQPAGAFGPEVGPDSVSLFEPVTPPQPPAASEPADEPAASEETQFVDLTTVEPPEPEALSGAGGQGEGDATVVVITEPTLREGDDDAPVEDVPPPPETVRPSADPAYADPAYADPAYADPAYADPAWVDRGHPQPAYTPSSEGSSATGPASRAYEDLGPPAAPGTGGVPLLEELPGGWQAVRRRHMRQTITFLVALLGVLGLGTVAGLMYTGRVAWPFGGRVNVSTQLCTPSAPLPPRKIHVRVYNGSNRSGLARTVAGQLKALGFVVQETGNDPLEAKVTTAVEIRFGDGGERAGKTASAYFAGKIRQRRDDRTNDLVDVVLGPKYTRLNTRRETTRALAVARPTMPLSCPAGVTPPPTPTPTPKVKPTPKR